MHQLYVLQPSCLSAKTIWFRHFKVLSLGNSLYYLEVHFFLCTLVP